MSYKLWKISIKHYRSNLYDILIIVVVYVVVQIVPFIQNVHNKAA